MIHVENLCQTFNGRRGPAVEALRGIDLSVDEGEFVAAIGRSGCGKSTLLRLIAGLLPATTGHVSVAGDRVRRPSREVGMMFQRPALLPWRTVLDNVLLPVEIFGWHRPTHRDPPRGPRFGKAVGDPLMFLPSPGNAETRRRDKRT